MSALTDIQNAAIQILLDRALCAKVAEINMADKFPNVRALPAAFDKMASILNDEAGKVIEEISKATDQGAGVVGKWSSAVKETRAAFDEVERALNGGTNGGPLSTTGS